MCSVVKKSCSVRPEPIPVRSLPSSRYTTGSTRSYVHTYAARGMRWRSRNTSSCSSRSPLARRRREVGVERVVAFEAEAVDLLEEQREQRDELRALEQVHVERVLEVGRRVRRDHERGAVGAQRARQLGDVRDRVREVLDDVRRDDVVDAAVAQRERGAVERAEAQPVDRRVLDRGRRASSPRCSRRRRRADPDPTRRRVSSPMPQPTSTVMPGPRRASTSRYPASWNASSESGVAPCIGRSPVSFMSFRLRYLAYERSSVQRSASRRARGLPVGATGRASRVRRGPALDSRAVLVRPPVPSEAHFLDRSRPRRCRLRRLASPATSPSWATSRRPPACAASRSSRWRDSTIPRPAARSCTRRGSRRCGARPASRSRCAPRTRPGRPRCSWRDGYRVIRKAGRYLVFPRAAFSEMMGWHGASDALVEIWNGMPFFSPVWAAEPARGGVAAPRPRLDVGDDAAAPARRARPHASSSGSRRRSTAARGS